jgi:dihydropteroate synthase
MCARSAQADRCEAFLGSVRVGGDHPVVVMGALNVSPESFYGRSIHRDRDALVRAGAAMARAGAALLDVGARSTAPYLPTAVDDGEEADRLATAVESLVAKVGLPVSADTARARAARAALDAGAAVLDDDTALADPAVARLAAERGVSVILMASPAARVAGAGIAPVEVVTAILRAALERARGAGITDERVVLDPGVGFFRDEAMAWDEWDATVIGRLDDLAALGRPLCVGVSRKSFLGAITGRRDPADRLAASLAATAVAVWRGAAVVRAHDVQETVDAVRVASRLARAGRPGPGKRA